MATAASIPPELFADILHHVGYVAYSRSPMLRQFDSQERRDTIRHLASCSLTCVSWARACRPKIYKHIRLQSWNDLHRLSSLVLGTSAHFTPVSAYIEYAELVQRLDERFWLHTLPLQPSCGLGVLTSGVPRIDIRIVGRSLDHRLENLTIPRLFAGLPRNLPSHILPCDTLLLQGLHLRTLNAFKNSLLPFTSQTDRPFEVHLVDSKSDGRIRADALFAGRPLHLAPSPVYIRAWDCSNNAELAWVAFACCGEQSHSRSTHPMILHPSDQRVIYAILSIMHQVSAELFDKPVLELCTGGDASYFVPNSFRMVCGLQVYRRSSTPSNDAFFSEDKVYFGFKFYTNPELKRGTPKHVTMVEILPPYRYRHATISSSETTTYPWDQMVDLLNSLPELSQLRFKFYAREDLVQFVEANRAALARLHDQIKLRYGGTYVERMVDFVTLEDTLQFPDSDPDDSDSEELEQPLQEAIEASFDPPGGHNRRQYPASNPLKRAWDAIEQAKQNAKKRGTNQGHVQQR
ncbi:hypothetical protein BC835DRAFT_1425307 [Cytidiella melzeri]|nr:hypothetical protein BC835DRAFT_1425307 [Cytidiella melzeri]